MKCNICLLDIEHEHNHLDSISVKLFRDIIAEIFHMQIFPLHDAEVLVCIRCEQKLHEINDFYHMILRCHTFVDQTMNSLQNDDFLQELEEDEIQNALDLLGSTCELSEFETFNAIPAPKKMLLCNKDSDEGERYQDSIMSRNEEKIMKNHKFDEKRSYICDMCNNTLKTKDALKQHMLMKHLTSKVSCQKCFKLLNPASLYLHYKFQHSLTFMVQCPVCKITLKHDRALNEHLKKIHKVKKPPCDKKFHRICSACGKIYGNKNSFYDHIRIKHPKQKADTLKVSCEICRKEFNRRHLLLKHLKTHSTNKESCPICLKTFSNQNLLSNHFKLHKSETQFQCEFCPNVYLHKSSLKSHLQICHLPKTEIECLLCHRWISSEYALKGHLRRVHKNNSTKQITDKSKIAPVLNQYDEVFL
uniref:CSON012586 protein n=1 Tax=Culicoides sonorensis TaxID=179676 RepID=A0A336MB59_CULSO